MWLVDDAELWRVEGKDYVQQLTGVTWTSLKSFRYNQYLFFGWLKLFFNQIMRLWLYNDTNSLCTGIYLFIYLFMQSTEIYEHQPYSKHSRHHGRLTCHKTGSCKIILPYQVLFVSSKSVSVLRDILIFLFLKND